MSGEQRREHQHIQQAPARSQLSFVDWVKQVEAARGSALVAGDPWAPVVDAHNGLTWYDLWLQGASVDEAAQR